MKWSHYCFIFIMGKSRGYKGVYKCGKKFRAQLQNEGVQYYLGMYCTDVEAAKAYDACAKKLGAKASLNFEEASTTGVPLLNVPSVQRQRRGRSYANVRKPRIECTTSQDTSDEDGFLGDVTVEELTDMLIKIDDECDRCSLSEFSVRSSTKSVHQYFAGILSYDKLSEEYRYIGTWLVSSTGKPTMSEFISSTNYFEFHSDKVCVDDAICKTPFKGSCGTLCGLIKPCSTRFRGFTSALQGDVRAMQVEKDFYITMNPFGKHHNELDALSGYRISGGVCDNCDSEDTISGLFDGETGVLEMARLFNC